MNAIGYVRLSSKDQSKYSLEDQESAIRKYCITNCLNLIAIFKDNGQTSSTFDRLDFKALELFVKRHRGEVRYLIVMEHDRFSRDLSEALSKIRGMDLSWYPSMNLWILTLRILLPSSVEHSNMQLPMQNC